MENGADALPLLEPRYRHVEGLCESRHRHAHVLEVFENVIGSHVVGGDRSLDHLYRLYLYHHVHRAHDLLAEPVLARGHAPPSPV